MKDLTKPDLKILLIGLGPHSQRIYLSGLKHFGLKPAVIVDLESKQTELLRLLQKHALDSELVLAKDIYRDARSIEDSFQDTLLDAIKRHKITHVIVSTEPKAHYAYLKFLIPLGLPILTDKPITAPTDVINDPFASQCIEEDFLELERLSSLYKTPLVVQCQRRYDARYHFVLKQIRSLIKQFKVPVTHVQINHCDGSFNMPDEYFSRENHPYKYGYGKLFHSGYHFIDLLSQILSYDILDEDRQPNRAQILSSHYSPNDQMWALNEDVMERLFHTDHYSEYYQAWRHGAYRSMGELDVMASIEFMKDDYLVTTCSLNLLQSGFSKRAWFHLPKDTYKSNGRVRHEMLNIQIGPLANIQVHSYQAYEVKERQNKQINHLQTGGLEHFDIHIFRNSELIGGKAFELIKGKDLYEKKLDAKEEFLGYNEHARHACLDDFLNNRPSLSDLKSQRLTIKLVSELYKTMQLKRKSKAPLSAFTLEKDYAQTPLHR